MISSFLLYGAAGLAAIGAAAHSNYRGSSTIGGVMSPDASRILRNVALVLATVAGCVGASLKVGGF